MELYPNPRAREPHPARGRAAVPRTALDQHSDYPPPPPPAAKKPWWRNGPGKLNTWIIGAGGLAGAITAVLALYVSIVRDSEEAASFTSIAVDSNVLFREFRQRWTPMQPKSSSMRRPGPDGAFMMLSPSQPTGPAVSASAIPRGASGSATPGSSDSNSTPGGSTGPAKSSATAAPRMLRAPLLVRPGFTDAAANVPPIFRLPDPDGGRTPTAGQQDNGPDIRDCNELDICIFIHDVVNNAEGDSSTAGRGPTTRTTELKDFRTIKVKGEKKRSAVGVTVSVNLELIGLRGKPLWLSWSLWKEGSGNRLFGDWLNEHLAIRITADTDHDTTSGNFWIPLPAVPGTYHIQALLSHDKSVLARVTSPSFR